MAVSVPVAVVPVTPVIAGTKRATASVHTVPVTSARGDTGVETVVEFSMSWGRFSSISARATLSISISARATEPDGDGGMVAIIEQPR